MAGAVASSKKPTLSADERKELKRVRQGHFRMTWVKVNDLVRARDGGKVWGKYVSSQGPKTAAEKAGRVALNELGVRKATFEIMIINRNPQNKYYSKRGTKYVYEARWTGEMTEPRQIKVNGVVVKTIGPIKKLEVREITMIRSKTAQRQ